MPVFLRQLCTVLPVDGAGSLTLDGGRSMTLCELTGHRSHAVCEPGVTLVFVSQVLNQLLELSEPLEYEFRTVNET